MSERSGEEARRGWLLRTCPECGSRPNRGCRDEAGFFAYTHESRFRPDEAGGQS